MCRDCKLYDLEAVKDKAGRVRSQWAAKCLWESTEVWPVSALMYSNNRPVTSYMQPNEVHRCQRFIKRGESDG